MLRSFRLYSQFIGYNNFTAYQRKNCLTHYKIYISRLYSGSSDDGKDLSATTRTARLHNARRYVSGTQKGKDDSSKSPSATKSDTEDTHKGKIESSNTPEKTKSDWECLQKSSASQKDDISGKPPITKSGVEFIQKSGSQTGKEKSFKPIVNTSGRECVQKSSAALTGKDEFSKSPIVKSDKEIKQATSSLHNKACIKPVGEYKPPRHPDSQPTGQKQKIECPPRKDKINEEITEDSAIKYIIGGILLLLCSALGVYLYQLNKDETGADDEDEETIGSKKRKPRIIVKTPENPEDIPNVVPYLLIGGGTASFAAFRAIKSADPTAKVLVISDEEHFPYMRPPLSKEMWFNKDPSTIERLSFKQWNGSERSLYYEPSDFFVDCEKLFSQSNGGVAVARGWTVKKVDATERKVILENDYEIAYEKCLIATGSTPKNLKLFENASDGIKEKVTLFRGILDFAELEEIIRDGAKSIAIVGGGFLGSELACALARSYRKNDLQVYQIFRESGNMGNVLPEYLSVWTTDKVRTEGVNVVNNAEVSSARLEGNQIVLSLNNGKKVKADQVVVAIGVNPNTELAGPSDLELDEEHGGFRVNAELMARTNLWSAGDCTSFYDVKLGRRRVEHHDHAVVSGRLAGENMTGAGKPYWHQSMFWSDLGPDVGYEAIGIVDSTLPTVGVFAKATEKDTPQAVVTATDEGDRAETEAQAEPVSPAKKEFDSSQKSEDYGKGIVFYLRDNTVVGIVMWNVFNRMSVARQVLKDGTKYTDLNEVAKLFNIHEE